EPGRQPEMLRGGGGGVGAKREEAGVAERDLPGIAGEQIPARGEQGPDHRLRRETQHEGMRDQRGQRDDDGRRREEEQPPSARPHRAVVRPSSPCGRTRSAAIITTKATPFCHCEGTTMTTSDSAMPMSRLARSAPARLPMPPRIVIANALNVSGKPTA